MKKLNDILQGINVLTIQGNADIEISELNFDSRKIQKNNLFIAVSGTTTDGHSFISKSIESGAIAIVCEQIPENIHNTVTYIQVENCSDVLGKIASNYFDNPSSKIQLVGITGTNGKTTTATLSYQLAKHLGYKCGLLSTVKNYIDNQAIDATHTTPDAIQINFLLNEMVHAGCDYCFMEVSSHAIVQNRISGLTFKGAVFTNITHDHLDYHKTFEEYLKAKKLFFDKLQADAFALVNIDDRNGKIMMQNTSAKKLTYALMSLSDFRCRITESLFDGMQLQFDGNDVWTRLIGTFNAYNLLAIYGTAILLGHNKNEVLQGLSKLTTVDGRFEYIRTKNDITAIVDYAHTPDALVNVLKTINEIRNGQGRLFTVVGAGGNRDRTKRPVMGKVCSEMSDKVILTSDNPRNEIPENIIEEIFAGVEIHNKRKTIKITDRKEAIIAACSMCERGDILLVAGKGHENYQEIKGEKHHFNDKEIIINYFNELI
ncbi:MAG: UDP-N-acetylmuramoyl-L-alanyl-D-glutamate--2,6-diaminopimelate ligase [Bacteroidetes bacterium RIFOXYA12_FULL_35_11]|nr:MAG: UDP-N-acetylmuramoyl-L-alanyl-D-glutamate--2,6-diaminopimelate ligase [Bacteroidetes bacterium GWF2_35_48]OFY72465.1 MAG: UDP-N-acetylmuramoyl-L-alanyl-D-glutamate--2,6-diaminopimelate ligase [Bacteroidetes bacterium RIFOXYA12_FULL_35_11]OFY93869.1 MAG: UDP-N-acetylmuramoyl-L-alanyl-D-glutamate--2,6-diaminopimelate ligase [Bacteroidetes bacterium RIFOXYC12_FULL_35_7]HBX50499.1 UDP-N-acetylmuramoyl-L-alanyl-D-glutamate--2,6-diaminopimelate ligase [Bacteroidales bacterium]